jgi:RNA polymerase sigma factor (TIGR02999 family)
MAAPTPQTIAEIKKDSSISSQRSPVKAPSGDVTVLLQRLADGDAEAEHELYTLVYFDLKKCAHNIRRRFLRMNDIQTTELIGSVYIRLTGVVDDQAWRNRQHFVAFFARHIRWYLIENIRKWGKVKLDALDGLENLLSAPPGYNPELAILVHQLLQELSKKNPRWVTLVEMKWFAGFTDQETAAAMGMSLRGMQRTWLEARNWLFRRLGGANGKQSAGR